MPKNSTPKEPHRSFTVRTPQELYNTIGDLATEEGIPVNVKVNQLIKLGLGRHVSLDEALKRLIRKGITE